MSHALRTVATCAVAFGIMAVVGSAARETDASSAPTTQAASLEAAGSSSWQIDVTPDDHALGDAPVNSNAAVDAESIPVPIKGFVYIPETVIVPAGSSVAWINEDNAPHTSTGIGDAISALDSGAIVFGQTFTQEFSTPGTYPYYCVYHPNMLGTVVVTP